MAKHRTIEIALSLQHPYTTIVDLLRGIGQYSRRFGPWKMVLIRPDSDTQWPGKTKSKPDGTIVDFDTYTRLGREQGPYSQRPCVCLLGVNLGVKVPVYAPDDPQAGRLAAEHLIQRGLENLAFCGTQEAFSRRREAGFLDAAGEEGIEIHSIVPPGRPRRLNRASLLTPEKIRPWLEQLPLPVGILACTDAVAANVLEACSQASLRIPEEVSIVGVDNDEVICDYSQATLTSIDRDMQRVGYQAAGGLDRLMNGQDVEPAEHLTHPKRVVARESTDRLMHRNPQFAQAWQFMRDRCGEPITLEDVLDEVPVSRSTLERSFKQALGRTPGEELRRLRLNRACKLLEETTMPMIEVATHCGMSSLSYFSQAFKKQFKMPPTEYRKRSGL